MKTTSITRRGFLAMALAAGAATAAGATSAQAFGLTATAKPAQQNQASTMQSETMNHHNGDSFWSYNTRPRRKDPGPLAQPPRKRPCANRPGHGCR